MNDSIDMKLYQYFENVSIPNELDKVIEQAIPKKKQRKSYKYNQYLARVASIFVICILAGGIVFAKDIANYVTELFAHTHQGVVKALENGYVANIDMDYAYSNDTGIKVDSIMMDDFNLLITFTLKLEENIDNINHLEITDLLVTDENKNIVFCNYDNIKVIVPNDGIGVISCVFDGYSSDNIGQVLSDYKIATRTGLHCSPEAHKFLGTFPAGTVRFSVGYFNSDDDFVKLREALDYIEENS